MATPTVATDASTSNHKTEIEALNGADMTGDVEPDAVGAAFTDATFLARQWWSLAARGLAAIALGVIALIAPIVALLGLVVIFGAYALIDGVFSFVMAARSSAHRARWGWHVMEGLAGIAAGLITFAWPGVTVLVLILVIGTWAVVTGIAKIATALHFDKHVRGAWMLVASGVLSVGMGVVLWLFPFAAEVAVTWWIGVYGIVFGILALMLSFRLRELQPPKQLDSAPPAENLHRN